MRWLRLALVSPDGVTPSRMVGVSASVKLPLHHKVQKFSSFTGSPGWSRKKVRKMIVVVVVSVAVWQRMVDQHYAVYEFHSYAFTCKMRIIQDKPVGFYGPIVPPVPNAPSSRICGQNPRNDADATFVDPHISDVNCCCSAGSGTPPVLTQLATIGGRLPEWQTSKCIFSVSFVRIDSKFFTIHRRYTGAKNDGPEF